MDAVPVVMLWQCPESLVKEFRPWVFRTRPFYTPLIDLSRSEEELLQKLEPKSCRYEVRKAQKLGCVITVNEDIEAARLLMNRSIQQMQYRGPIGEGEWQALLKDHDIFLIKWQDHPVAVHVLTKDFPGRARLLLSATEDRSNERFRTVAGPANRLLHWHEIQSYKAQGYKFYDLGGCDDPAGPKTSPTYSISQFKLSFGAEVVSEPMLYLTRKPGLRMFLKSMAAVRNGLKRIPWPQSWLKALRSRPKLGQFFR
jgi:hypothetical protein